MSSDEHPASSAAVDEGRLMIERAEAAWQRQIEGEAAVAAARRTPIARIVLLGIVLAVVVFLLLQRLAGLG